MPRHKKRTASLPFSYVLFSIRLFGRFEAWIILLASSLKLFEVAGNFRQKFVISRYNVKICLLGVIQNIRLSAITVSDLVLQQVSVLLVRLCIDVVEDQRFVGNGNHVVEPEQPVFPAVQLQNVLSRLNVGVVRLGRLHGNEITEFPNGIYDSNVGAGCVLVILHTGISLVQIPHVVIRDLVNSQCLHFSLHLGMARR